MSIITQDLMSLKGSQIRICKCLTFPCYFLWLNLIILCRPDYHILEVGSCYRINGQLAVSRSIGDYKYKPAVTSEPEIQAISLGSLDQFLVLASDGLYSKVNFDKKRVSEFIISCIKENKTKEEITEELVSQAIACGSSDNVTVIVVDLAELYKRWQRSTPFQGNSKQQTFNRDSNLTMDDSQSDITVGRRSMIKYPQLSKPRSIAGDTEMEVEVQACSPFSGPSTSTFCSWKRSSDGAMNNNSFDSDKNVHLSVIPTSPKSGVFYGSVVDSTANPFWMPKKAPSDVLRRNKSTNIEHVNRIKTHTKKNSDRKGFTFE